MNWALGLCQRLEQFNSGRSEPLYYGVNLRVSRNLQAETLFTAMAAANFSFVNIGLESGSERVRREVLHRNYSNDDIIQTVKAARQFGLSVCLFNMIGLPTETYAEHLETVRINRLCQPDWHYTGVFFPYPGTDLYQQCKELGMLPSRLDVQRERQQAVLSSEGFTAKQIQRSLTWFNFRVYHGHKPLFKLCKSLLPVLAENYPWMKKPLSVLFNLKHRTGRPPAIMSGQARE
jgi:radical SAM superfamily enzyme YgiQ (UPF0313 family)